MVNATTPETQGPVSDTNSINKSESPTISTDIQASPTLIKKGSTRRPPPKPLDLTHQPFPPISCSIRTSPSISRNPGTHPAIKKDRENETAQSIHTLALQLTSPGLPPYVGAAAHKLKVSKEIEIQQRDLIKNNYKIHRQNRKLRRLKQASSDKFADLNTDTSERPQDPKSHE